MLSGPPPSQAGGAALPCYNPYVRVTAVSPSSQRSSVVEQLFRKQQVVGSTPTAGSSLQCAS